MDTSAQGGYDPVFFDQLAAVEDRHFWFRARNDLIARLASRLTAPLPAGYLALEVGCGTGNVLRYLAKACDGGTVVGMDLFPEGLRHARRRTTAALVQGDLRRHPFQKPAALIGIFDV